MWKALYVAIGIVFVFLLSIPHRAGRAKEPVPNLHWVLAALLWPVLVPFCLYMIIRSFVRTLRGHE